MKEDDHHIDYFQLIPRYLSGDAGDPEVKLLEEWVLSSPENKALFNALKKAWILADLKTDNPDIDIEKEWQSTAGMLFPESKIIPLQAKPKRRTALFVGVAAAAALLILASLWLFRSPNKSMAVEIAAKDEVLENRLPDGTSVSLNKHSAVRYIPGADKRYRRAELTGDAFFEVKRDTTRPFVINARHIEVEVLGTAFYVDARADLPEIQVIVQSGSVAVKAGAERIILSSDEIGIYDKNTGALTKKQNEDVNYLAWKTDILRFDKTALEKVVFDLNRKFQANISIADQEIRTCELTATYDHKSLDAIVKIIEMTLNIKAETKGEEIVFTGQGCD